jgi:drug/metabolite transporter (DMT)-like permease
MIAILGGLGAAAAWAASTLCASQASRIIEPASVVAWVALAGLAIILPIVLISGVPGGLDWSSGGWLLLAGAGNVAGLLAAYAAYRVGQVSLIAPIVSTEGAIAALIAILAGESLAARTAVVLGVIAAGVWLAARAPERRSAGSRGPSGMLGASLAASAFGASLYATGRVSSLLPVAWVVLSGRLVGSALVAAPLALSGRLQRASRAAPLVLVAGACEVIGFGVFALGARHGVAVTAVLSSQFAAMSALGAYFLFSERLGRGQFAGVAIVIAGVSVLTVLQA